MSIYTAETISIPLLYAGWVYWFARHLRQRNPGSFFAALSCLILLTAGTLLYMGFIRYDAYVWIPLLLFVVTISLTVCWMVKTIRKGEGLAAGGLALTAIGCTALGISVMMQNYFLFRCLSGYDWRMYSIGASVVLMMVLMGSDSAEKFWQGNKTRDYVRAIIWTTVLPMAVGVAYYVVLQARWKWGFDWSLVLSAFAAIWMGLSLIAADETRATLKWVLCLLSLAGIAGMISIYQTDYTRFFLPYRNDNRFAYLYADVSCMDYAAIFVSIACVFWLYWLGQLPLKRKIFGWRVFPATALILFMTLKIKAYYTVNETMTDSDVTCYAPISSTIYHESSNKVVRLESRIALLEQQLKSGQLLPQVVEVVVRSVEEQQRAMPATSSEIAGLLARLAALRKK